MNSRNSIVFCVAFVLILLSAFIIDRRANALINLNPNPASFGTIPVGEGSPYDTLRKADTYGRTPAFVHWISRNGPPTGPNTNYSKTDLVIPYADRNGRIELALNFAGVVGFTPSQVTKTKDHIINHKGNLSGVPRSMSLDFTPNYNSVGTYRHKGDNIYWREPNGFQGSGRYDTWIDTKKVNEFRRSNGALVYRCVHNGNFDIDVDSIDDIARCPVLRIALSFRVTIDSEFNTRSVLVQGPRVADVASMPNMPNASSTVRYNRETNAIINGFGRVADNTNTVTYVNSRGDVNTRIYAPSIISINDVEWTPRLAVICNIARNPGGCRAAGSGGMRVERNEWKTERTIQGFINRKYVQIDQLHPDGENMTVYWYYEQRPSLACTGLTASVNEYRQALPVTLTWTSTGANRARLTTSTGVVINNDNNLPANGSIIHTPGQPVKYTLTVFNAAGESDFCETLVAQKPYYRIYANDAAAGSKFVGSLGNCEPPPSVQAAFLGYNTGLNPFRGAGADMALFALGAIQEVPSANTRNIVNPKSETFANSASTGTYGGNSEISRCMPDYFAGVMPATGDLTLNTLPPPAAREIFQEGDVFITNNIINLITGANNTPLRLFVKGNIYISPGVGQLDGFIIAQEDSSGEGGYIYTCATAMRVPVDTSNVYNSCRTSLTVNGAMIAKGIKLGRVFGTLGQSPAIGVEQRTSNNVAEKFIFGPELYLNAGGSSGGANLKYDSIISLPPVF